MSELSAALGALASEVLGTGAALPPRLARFAVFNRASSPEQRGDHKAGQRSAVQSAPTTGRLSDPARLGAVRQGRGAKSAANASTAYSDEPERSERIRGLAEALALGEAAKVQWVASAEVVPARVLAELWGLTPQALGPAAARGEVFAIVVKSRRYYPREFLGLERDTVSAVTRALDGLSPSEKLVFWKRPHGALGGKTVLQALGTPGRAASGGGVARVTDLARVWSQDAHASRDPPAAD